LCPSYIYTTRIKSDGVVKAPYLLSEYLYFLCLDERVIHAAYGVALLIGLVLGGLKRIGLYGDFLLRINKAVIDDFFLRRGDADVGRLYGAGVPYGSAFRAQDYLAVL